MGSPSAQNTLTDPRRHAFLISTNKGDEYGKEADC